jgi:hypothetical protein
MNYYNETMHCRNCFIRGFQIVLDDMDGTLGNNKMNLSIGTSPTHPYSYCLCRLMQISANNRCQKNILNEYIYSPLRASRVYVADWSCTIYQNSL